MPWRPEPARTLVQRFNQSAPGANTDILATAIQPEAEGSAFRVTVALTTASVFNVEVSDGTTTHLLGLNGSAALQAADLYTFVFAAPYQSQAGVRLSYNFQVETDSVIELLSVEEIRGDTL